MQRINALTLSQVVSFQAEGDEVSEIAFPIVGISHEDRKDVVFSMVEDGLVLYLEREPLNYYDRNAIKIILADGTIVGYVPRNIAAVLARDLDIGIRYDARVTFLDKYYDYTLPKVEVTLDRRF